MKVVYVSGPYSATKNKGVNDNIASAKIVAEMLWRRGWAVICPHLNTANMESVADYEVFMEGDMEILFRCDAIYMLNGWLESSGAVREHNFAESSRKFIMYEANND